uniref:Predicted nuclease of the RNAse H fold, HicB family n=1 Tax=Candidatus Kentrum sp. FW TaxID=2126338 RepID=A0A450TCG8_9GAMM|nr:MAG: Predicted nuclease of the RNAse H fold, HicB family [Candidatus Kentron sp. FW]
MNSMKYNGYVARIEYDEEDRIFVGHLAGIRDIVGFHGTTVDELEKAFHESVDSYVAISEETGRPAQSPYSGKLMLQIPPDTHAAVAIAAEVHGKSIDQWASDVLSGAARQGIATNG